MTLFLIKSSCPLAMPKPLDASSPPSNQTALAGAVAPSGKDRPQCASACPRGQRRKTMLSEASQLYCGLLRRKAIGGSSWPNSSLVPAGSKEPEFTLRIALSWRAEREGNGGGAKGVGGNRPAGLEVGEAVAAA